MKTPYFGQYLKGKERKDELEEVFEYSDANYKDVDQEELKQNNVKTLKDIKSDFKKIKRNEKQKNWYAWRKRAEKAGVSPLKSKRPTFAERNKWEKAIVKAESESLSPSQHPQGVVDKNKTLDKDSNQ